MVTGLIKRALTAMDGAAAALSPGLIREGSGLITVLFHSLYLDRDEAGNGNQDPQQALTVAQFREFVKEFQKAGYAFVAPGDLETEAPAGSRRVMITFDDGYYNNTRAVPVLAEFGVPATFFISTGHVQQGKSFWWDAAYRSMAKAGLSPAERKQRMRGWKRLRNHEIEAALRAEFGQDCLRPVGDSDRPLTPEELREFAGAPHVHIGNHTVDHAILPNYLPVEMAAQIRGCQAALAAMTGSTPRIIAYPNGDSNASARGAAEAEGLVTGIGLLPMKNATHGWNARRRMDLGRFILWGDRDIGDQCREFRSGIAPGAAVKRLLKKGY